jgi:hypothetical protein
MYEQTINLKIMKKEMHSNAPAGAVYGLGLIGAAIFYISHAAGFWMGVLGFLKALVWPAFLVYELLKHLSV